MSALLLGAAVLAGGFLAARHLGTLTSADDLHDVFDDDDLVLGGRLTYVLHDEAEDLMKGEGR
ncbi:hypothetical protein [Streptosporangium sp. CA-115845]|uniref:hypothetical protein n=1 Tax=Streptosporangium sp. CA-115845 TaxID=3240071 RepID=UPI003D8A2A03